MEEFEESKPMNGRFNTNDETKRIVWIQSAGHCELCGTDLTFDYRAGKCMKWGELCISCPSALRASADVQNDDAEARTNNTTNLMILCPGCHLSGITLPKPSSVRYIRKS